MDHGGVPKFIKTSGIKLQESRVASSSFKGDALLLKPCSPPWHTRLPSALTVIQIVILSGLPHGNFFSGQAIKVAVSYYVTSLLESDPNAFNRIQRISSVLGEENAKVYSSRRLIRTAVGEDEHKSLLINIKRFF